MKKSSTLKFMMYISFVPLICIHRSIILISIEKSMLVDFVSTENIFSSISDFPFRKNSRFCDKFQALITLSEKVKRKSRVSDQIRISLQ